MTKTTELPWCEHGINKTGYCADCKVASLITTIESLQREIASHAPEGRNYTNGQYVELLLKFESQKEEIEKSKLELIECEAWAESRFDDFRSEIKKLQKPAIHLAYTVLKQKHEQDAESFIEHINGLEIQFESLKAITELAVKALKWYADKEMYSTEHLSKHGFIPIDHDEGEQARNALSEIERLSK